MEDVEEADADIDETVRRLAEGNRLEGDNSLARSRLQFSAEPLALGSRVRSERPQTATKPKARSRAA
jgi:hypothetical protein